MGRGSRRAGRGRLIVPEWERIKGCRESEGEEEGEKEGE